MIILLALVCFFASFAPACAVDSLESEGVYVMGFAGVSLLDPPEVPCEIGIVRFGTDPGTLIGVRSGYRWWAYSTSMEWEVSYRRDGFNSLTSNSYPGEKLQCIGTSHQTSFLVNAVQELGDLGPTLVPYTGVGVGITYIDQDWRVGDLEAIEVAINPTWQAILGLRCVLPQGLHASAEYRYLDSGKHLHNSAFTLGLEQVF